MYLVSTTRSTPSLPRLERAIITRYSPSIIGYTYRAESYYGESIIEQDGVTSNDYPESMSVEDVLDAEAALRGINREDEYSFDSDDFPKVIFAL